MHIRLIESHFHKFGRFYYPLFGIDLEVVKDIEGSYKDLAGSYEIKIPDSLRHHFHESVETFQFWKNEVQLILVDNQAYLDKLQQYEEDLPDVFRSGEWKLT